MKLLNKILLLAGLCTACGKDESRGVSGVEPETVNEASAPQAEPTQTRGYPQTLYIATLDGLPACGEANARQLIYVAEDASFRACVGSAWIVVEANTVTKTETIVEKAMPAAKDPVIVAGFGNWIATDTISEAPAGEVGDALAQVTLSEMPNNQAKLNVTRGQTIYISEVIDIDRIPWIFSKAPYILPNGYPFYQAQVTDWSMTSIKITVLNNNPPQTWNVKLTKK